MTIRKVSHGYKVYSEKTGKPLSRTLTTHEQAVKRLQQVDWFKAHPKGKK